MTLDRAQPDDSGLTMQPYPRNPDGTQPWPTRERLSTRQVYEIRPTTIPSARTRPLRRKVCDWRMVWNMLFNGR